MKHPQESHKQQEVLFVEWSRDLEAEPDVTILLDVFSSQEGRALKILDVGGGIGSLGAEILAKARGTAVDVIDNSSLARESFIQRDGLRLIFADFLDCHISGTYDFVIFRTVLHHFVARSDDLTEALQLKALQIARSVLKPEGRCFVLENFYEPSVLKDATGWLIFQITKLRSIHRLTRHLGANTAGEGVRFRSQMKWAEIFSQAGFHIDRMSVNPAWGNGMPIWQRVPLLCSRRYQALVELVVIDAHPSTRTPSYS